MADPDNPRKPETNQPSEAATREDKREGTKGIILPAEGLTAQVDHSSATLLEAACGHQQRLFDYYHHPYIVYSPVNKPTINNPVKCVSNMFASWTRKASDASHNIWHNLTTVPSVSGAACGKISLAAKAVSKGGFQMLFKHSFNTEPYEKLNKSFACYLSTTAGPVAGTLYLSTVRIGFHSDRPFSFVGPTGQQAWCYYKVMIQWGNMSSINPGAMSNKKPREQYIELVTVDGYSFWLMGFVNFEKALHNLVDTLSGYRTAELASSSAAR